MARGDQLLRQWNLLRLLQTRGEGIALKDLAQELDVVERTIQRDLELLQELGFPVEFDADETGKRFWRMPHDFFKTGPLVLSMTEAISLHIAEHFFRPLTGTLFADGLDRILSKIRSILPAPALDHFSRLEEAVHVRGFGSVNYADKAEVLKVLFEAARSNHQVNVTYRSLWRRSTYETRFDPYGIVLYEDDLYAVGRSHRADAFRVFKVSRIQSAALETSTFERPDDFRLDSAFRDTFGISQSGERPIEIVVKFEGSMAGLVEEREWHPSQQLHWLSSDQTLFEFPSDEPEALVATFHLAGVIEFKRWIMSFGDKAEVLRPASLRNEIRQELAAAASRYGESH